MEDMNSLLQQSVAIYRSLLEQTTALPKLLKYLSTDDVEAYLCQYRETLDKARALDTTLIEKIKASQADVRSNPLFIELQELMGSLAENNIDMSSLLNGKLALVSSEISQIRQGKTVTAGYRPSAANRNGSRLKISG